MNFKPERRERLEREYKMVHQKTVELMGSIEAACLRLGYAHPVATHIYRYKSEQVKFYTPMYLKKGLTVEDAMKKAALRPTWHYWLTAIDLRDWVWTPAQVQRILVLAREQVADEPGKWEILYHDVGQGMHLHFAYKDESWKLREEEFRNALASFEPGRSGPTS